MARILTGIQSTGVPHLGNVLGAIQPMIQLSNTSGNEAFAFIADLHSLTTIKDSAQRNQHINAVSAAWIACGFDYNKNTLYKQSDAPEVTELTWYLNCFAPFPMLANAHSFKDKSDRLSDVNAGLFTYPVLMAADIIGYDANIVPVGKDQIQHLEITRDIAKSFNHQYGDTFIIPETSVNEEVMIIPGTDGQKMSKSYNNTISIFNNEKELKKEVMSIITDSTPLEEPKNPDTCNVFNIYKVVATPSQTEEIRNKYVNGGFGYGHAKNALLEILIERFKKEREAYQFLMNNPKELDAIMKIGSDKARKVLGGVLKRVRGKLGFSI
jgi:tryptophanyl-tRNA synthetase